LSLVILRLQALPEANAEAIDFLREVDHRLRIAQLDDLIDSGPTRIASLVQPHVRRSLDLGVVVNPLPGFEQVDVAVDSETGRLISRVLAVLFSNAMNAGASKIGLDVIVGPLEVEIRVTDDAGGFDLGNLQPGRGLEELMVDLGRDGVVREAILGGSVMRVTVPRSILTWASRSQPESVHLAPTRRRIMTIMRGRCC
jgi:signal transduction histidine kinase